MTAAIPRGCDHISTEGERAEKAEHIALQAYLRAPARELSEAAKAAITTHKQRRRLLLAVQCNRANISHIAQAYGIELRSLICRLSTSHSIRERMLLRSTQTETRSTTSVTREQICDEGQLCYIVRVTERFVGTVER
jgi:hypothetical protein